MYYSWLRVIQVPLSERTDTLMKVTDITQELGISLCGLHSIVHDHLDYRKLCAGSQRTSLTITKLIMQDSVLSFWHVTLIKEISFCSAVWMGDETWVIHVTPKTKRHDDGKTPIVSPSTGIQIKAIGKKEHGNCLFGPYRCASCACSGLRWCCNCNALLQYIWDVVAGLLSLKAWLGCQLCDNAIPQIPTWTYDQVMMLCLGGYGPCLTQSWSHAQWFPSLWTF